MKYELLIALQGRCRIIIGPWGTGQTIRASRVAINEGVRMMMKTVGERLAWFQMFMSLYEKAAPLVRSITDLGKLQRGELPLSPHALAESNLTLRPILDAVRKMREPEEKELRNIKREFEIALSSCIRAADSANKYIKLGAHTTGGQIQLSIIIDSMLLAHEYIESVSKRLNLLLEKA